jgi:hypothetical protein
MKEKLKSNMQGDNSRSEIAAANKRPPSTKPDKDEDDYSNGSFEKDENDDVNGED